MDHILKMRQLISAEAALSTKFTNVHWYQVIPETELLSLFWLRRQVQKQVMFNEVGTYSLSGADVVAALNTAAFLGAPEAIWWNQAGSGNAPLAQPLLNETTGGIQSNGVAFEIYVASSPTPCRPRSWRRPRAEPAFVRHRPGRRRPVRRRSPGRTRPRVGGAEGAIEMTRAKRVHDGGHPLETRGRRQLRQARGLGRRRRSRAGR